MIIIKVRKLEVSPYPHVRILLRQSPLHANPETTVLLPKSITCRFYYLQIHTTHLVIPVQVHVYIVQSSTKPG